MSLPNDAKARKALPICTGVLDYFPDGIAAVAHCSVVGNEQHNPGEPLHWARGKSTDQRDSAIRHIMDGRKTRIDTDGVRHLAKAAWRILAQLQLEIEEEQAAADAIRAGAMFEGGDYADSLHSYPRYVPPILDGSKMSPDDVAYALRQRYNIAIPHDGQEANLGGAVGPIGRRPDPFGCGDGTDF